MKRDLTLPYKGLNTQYYCGPAGIGAVKSKITFLGDDGYIYPNNRSDKI
jgi:hypothetical protein